MEASISSPVIVLPSSKISLSRSVVVTQYSKSSVNLITRNKNNHLIRTRTSKAINDVSAAADPAHIEVTWQIVLGTIAGITPFVVAGIEFSKRIVAQRQCGVCGGSGLVLRDKYYFRCPGCGGFLPWQSWKRFFSG